jgi:hypothetical protein
VKNFKVTIPSSGNSYKISAPETASENQIRAAAYWTEISEGFDTRFPNGLDETKYDSAETKKEVSAFKKFLYEFDKADTFSDHLTTWLEADFPLVDSALADIEFFESGFQKYGSEFRTLSPEQRRAFIAEQKEKELRIDYPEIYEAGLQDDTGFVGGVGAFAGGVTDWTSLIPFTAATKVGAFGLGAVLGGGFGFAGEKAKSSEVDYANVGTMAALGGALSLGGHVLLKAIQKKLSPDITPEESAAAKARTEEANTAILKAVSEEASGVAETPKPAGGAKNSRTVSVENKTGRAVEDIVADSQNSGTPLIEPSRLEAKVFGNLPNEGITPVSKATNSFLAGFVESLSTQIGRISPSLKLNLRKLDVFTHSKVWERQKIAKPFANVWNGSALQRGLSAQDKALATKYIYNRDFESAEAVFSKYGDKAVKAFKDVQGLYREMFDELSSVYPKLNKIENYWHRSIKDWEGLKKALGKEDGDALNQLIAKETIKQRKAGTLGKGELLPEKEAQRVLNNYFRGDYGKLIRERKLSAAQQRQLKTLDDDLIKFYDTPVTSLYKYIDESTYDFARKRFFGGAASTKGDGSFDTEKSVGELTNNLRMRGQITTQQAEELRGLLHTRFVNGEKSGTALIQGFRNIGYLSTLANPFSAATQLSDIGVTAWATGLRNTLAATVSPKKVSMKELGLDMVLSAEFRNEKVLSKALHKAFTVSGFRQLDRFGKDVLLNSALRKARIGSFKRNSKYGKQLDAKYKDVFGNEYEALLNELRTGQVTDRVKAFLWSELSDVQPISLSEMPIEYLNNPNGRLLWMLKSWTAKQLDLMRRNIRDEWANGNKKEAVKNAVSYSLIVPTFGVGTAYVRDSMLGLDPGLDELSSKSMDVLLKTFGSSEYMMNEVREARTSEDQIFAVGRSFLPPYQWFTETLDALSKEVQDENPDWNRVIKNAPIFGRAYYNFFGGGIENYEAWKRSL